VTQDYQQIVTVRTMNRTDLDRALDWAAAEGWNPGRHDDACFYELDPDGFFVAEVNREPVGCIAAVAHDDAFGWMGLFIVRPEFRGRGFALWNTALDRLGERTIGLDGVESQEANYAKSGFRTVHRDIRFEGIGGGTAPAGIVELASVPFAELAEFDAGIAPVARPRFLRGWISSPGVSAVGVRRNGRLAGYGVLRPCRVGYRIGPLYGEDEQIADDLFRALSARAAGAPVVLDVPDANPSALALAHRYEMREAFAAARMYAGAVPAVPLASVFGIPSMEVG
jgi:GNAT superfamily N-acetyltransferase